MNELVLNCRACIKERKDVREPLMPTGLPDVRSRSIYIKWHQLLACGGLLLQVCRNSQAKPKKFHRCNCTFEIYVCTPQHTRDTGLQIMGHRESAGGQWIKSDSTWGMGWRILQNSYQLTMCGSWIKGNCQVTFRRNLRHMCHREQWNNPDTPTPVKDAPTPLSPRNSQATPSAVVRTRSGREPDLPNRLNLWYWRLWGVGSKCECKKCV